ncbi:uncharacterized protein BDCG_16361 [Blastomyces dermatitidis ER-3]|uniref:Uncharacterized protein n=1 Tax=Ajellomyces dermatitidis (strain ER-3 / ATCC MYA-2586) TaxID=559297 RepID=A0ABX2VRL7_AJEDR|nr:uncharacterized protein BDCG_16361 [Blastomyces dermatitidis ER-3]OAS99870.1 hypothetical protein BDCG_16361 [Blastomyces dermatitidis ER-3]
MAMREAENRLNTDALAGRRDDISLQGMTTTATAVREAGEEEEEEDVIIKAVLLRLIDTVIFIFNLAFLAVTETVTASQRCLFTRKCQNKLFIILQE